MRCRGGIAALALLTGATACSTSGSGLSADAATVLQKDATALSTAARAGDRSQTTAALATLRSDVASERGRGKVSAGRAEQILDAAARVAADAPAPLASPRSTASPTPGPKPSAATSSAPTRATSPAMSTSASASRQTPRPPEPATSKPGKDNGKDKGNGKGKGKG